MTVQCVWSRTCVGGLSVWKAGSVSPGDRVAGADFNIPAGRTSAIELGLTTLGRQLVSPGGNYRADLIVVLQGAGFVDAGYPPPTLLLEG